MPEDVAVHAHEILENFLVMFGRDARAGIRNGNLDAVRALADVRGGGPAIGISSATRRSQKWGSARNVTLPPAGVCFNALSSRFATVCCTFW